MAKKLSFAAKLFRTVRDLAERVHRPLRRQGKLSIDYLEGREVPVADLFATFTAISSQRNFSYVGSATGATFTTQNISAGGVPVNFNYVSLPGLPADLQGTQNAIAILSSKTVSKASLTGGVISQGYNDTVLLNTLQLIRTSKAAEGNGAQTNLLTVNFTGTLSGANGSSIGSFGGSTASGQIVNFTSDFLNFAATIQRDANLNLNAINPLLGLNAATGNFNDFAASVGGQFASDPVPVSFNTVDLGVTKSVTLANTAYQSAGQGTDVTFTITVQNTGPVNATNVQLTDVVSAGLTNVTVVSQSSGTGAFNPATGVWNVGTVIPNTPLVLTLRATASGLGNQSNTATITNVTETDSNPGNNSASVPVNVVAPVDLQVVKQVRVNAGAFGTAVTAAVGDTVTFQVVLTNSNANPLVGTATGVSVRDVVPAGFGSITATPSVGTFNGGTGIWAVGSLAAGASATLTVTGTVQSTGGRVRLNLAQVNSADQPDGDSTPGNNTATPPRTPLEDDESTVTVTVPQANLGLVKQVTTPNSGGPVDAGQANIGDQVTFTINVSNPGASVDTATGVSVSDTLPLGLTFVSASGGSATSQTGNTITWNLANLAPGTTTTLTLIASVLVPLTAVATNTASVTTTINDPTPGNNTDTASVSGFTVDLAVTKDVRDATNTNVVTTAAAGATVTFNVRVLNNNLLGTATGVQVTDQLPAGFTLVPGSATTTVGTFNEATLVWTVGVVTPNILPALAPTLSFRAVYTGGTQTNVATITTSQQPDTVTTNNSASVTVSAAAGSIAGFVYVDANNNGAFDNGETPINGAVVTLTGPTPGSVTTGATGAFSFTNLTPGSYTLTETQPAGFADGKDTAGNLNGTVTNDTISGITVAAGSVGTGYLFGELSQGGISGTVFLDQNGNGTIDAGDNGIQGVTVTLTGPTGTTTTTANNGAYAFTGLTVGNYTITETQPTGYGSSTSNTIAVTLTAAGLVNQNFGETLGSLSGFVYVDANNNGSFDAGETPIQGATVTLGGAATGTATTTATGAYSFGNLLAGTYTLTETQPAGFNDGKDAAGNLGGNATATNDTITGIVVGAGSVGTGYLFGELSQGGISGTVFLDQNGNGTIDAGDNGIGGVTVTLTGPTGTSTTTANNGAYSFTGLTVGTYTITETQPVGYGSSTSNTITVTLTPAGLTGQNFGETLGSLSGFVYVDANNNGAFDAGETPISGASVTLSGAAAGATATTKADGSYAFTGLIAGSYTLTETQPVGFADGKDTAGNLGGDATATNDTVSGITLGAGSVGTNYHFGELNAGGVSGTVFVDANADGKLDAGEPGLTGVTLTLTGAPGTPTTTTTPGGGFTFSNVPPGNYTITQTQPTGYGSSTSNTVAVTVSTVPVTGQNFGETLGSISGVVFTDANNNGSQDAGETGIGGVTVTLGGAATATATTKADGTFTFGGLLAGTYTLTETQPAGFIDGTDKAGTAAGTAGNDTVTGIVLAGGTVATGYTFGELNGSVGGTVFADTNKNGTQDAGETGIGDVTLTLSGGGGSVTTTTKADGTYTFTNVPTGTYTITQTQPVLFGSSTPNSVTVSVTGTGTPAVNFGETLASLGGQVYVDVNNNGVRDAGEAGIAGVNVVYSFVNLLPSGPISGTFIAVTDANGKYFADNLVAGTYTIGEIQPIGYTDGQDKLGSSSGTLANDLVTDITLAGGAAATGYDFGEIGTTVAGRVFIDRNRSGAVDTGEGSLGNVTVTLAGPGGNATTTTAADGTYSFQGVAAGSYTITETQPVGYLSTTSDTIAATVPTTGLANQNFGEVGGSIAGTVFVDANNNGKFDAGEAGIPNTTVTLTGAGVTLTATTGTDGTYKFNDLQAGTYTLAETQPAGFTDGQDTTGTSGGTVGNDTLSGITLTAGTDATGYVFGELATTLTGRVFFDKNQDGVFNAGDSGIGSTTPGGATPIRIQITGAAGSQTTTTNADGTYSFAGLAPGVYTVVELDQPVGYGSQTPVGGVENTLLVTVPATGLTGVDFGERLGSVAGYVVRDSNGNGKVVTAFGNDPLNSPTLEAGDTFLGGVTITLTGVDTFGRQVFQQGTTTADGGFFFADLFSGTYVVTEDQATVPPPLLDGKTFVGFDGYRGPNNQPNFTPIGNVDPANNNRIENITLTPGQCVVDYIFSEVPPGSVNGVVFEDVNCNGKYDVNVDNLISGVSVTISGTKNTGGALTAADVPGGSLTFVTGANGAYSFGPLPQGTYTVVETQPAGYFDGPEDNQDKAGAPAVTVANDQYSNVVIGDGTVRGPLNFGEYKPAAIGGVVYRDDNNNGVRDLNEVGIAGVQITLSGTSRSGVAVTRTVVTKADGSYLFLDMMPGIYAITEAQPANYIDAAETVGTEGGVITANDVIGQIDLCSGDIGVNYNFGERQTGQTPTPPINKTQLLASTPPGGVTGGVQGIIVTPTLATAPTFNSAVAKTGAGSTAVTRFAVAAADAGAEPRVNVYNYTTGALQYSILAYDASFRGGVRVAVADVNGDGTPDIITTPGQTGGPHVKVFNGATGALLTQFFAYAPQFTGGVYVAAGDLNGDGRAEIITGAGQGGGPHVKAFAVSPTLTVSEFASLFAYDPSFTGGVRVAAGKVNADNFADIVTAPGVGGGPHVKVFSGVDRSLLTQFFAFDAGFTGGVYVAAGDLNGDGQADVIAGQGTGGSLVRAFSGANPATVLANFSALPSGYSNGVRVGAGELTGDNRFEIIVGAASGAKSAVRIIDAATFTDVDTFTAFDPASLSGAFVAGS